MIGPVPHPEKSARPALAIPSLDALAPLEPRERTLWSFFHPARDGEIRPFPIEDAEHLAMEFDWDDSLPFEGDVIPSLVPVGCNVYPKRREKGVTEQYIWLAFDIDGYTEDGPSRAEERWIGRRTRYHDHLLDEAGWGSALGFDWQNDWATWLLQNGIAPGQAFLVDVHVYGSRDYWGEYDEDWSVEVVAKEPWSDDAVRAAWVGAMPEVVRP